MEDIIKNLIQESIRAKQIIYESEDIISSIKKAVKVILEAFSNNHKLLVCGNGGSAADAQHIAAEFVGRFQREREGLAAVALTTDSSILTSIANDYDFKVIYQRQIEALGKKGDVLLGISTSGNSENIGLAFEFAKSKGITTIGLLGKDGGKIKNNADLYIIVPGSQTPRIQESHIMIGHIICQLVEEELFRGKGDE